MPKSNSSFRNFCIEKYYEHKKEILNWEKHACTEEMGEYFKRTKWFLKSLYKRENP